ncbi:MAG: hypothetical protein M3044_04820 [Thermoproteota archaeon]|nr:hypothetical protein [Thermoproteota archaeon]
MKIQDGDSNSSLAQGKVTRLEAIMTALLDNKTRSHTTHQLMNFHQTAYDKMVQPSPDCGVAIDGTVDVGQNNHISRHNIPLTISIARGKITSFMLDHHATNHSFGPQPMSGFAKEIVITSPITVTN